MWCDVILFLSSKVWICFVCLNIVCKVSLKYCRAHYVTGLPHKINSKNKNSKNLWFAEKECLEKAFELLQPCEIVHKLGVGNRVVFPQELDKRCVHLTRQVDFHFADGYMISRKYYHTWLSRASNIKSISLKIMRLSAAISKYRTLNVQ